MFHEDLENTHDANGNLTKKPPSIQEFALNLGEFCQRNLAVENHFEPQKVRLGENLADFDDIFPLERMSYLQDELSRRTKKEFKFGRYQTAGPKIGLNARSRDTLEALIEFYAGDYKLLARWYTPESIRERYARESNVRKHSKRSPNSEKLCFIHVPSCGGTTLWTVLNRVYRDQEVIRAVQLERGTYTREILEKSKTDRPHAHLIGGHFSFSIAKEIFPDRKMITLLRDPVDRAVSVYFRNIRNRRHVPDTSLGERDILDFWKNKKQARTPLDYLLDGRLVGDTVFPDSSRMSDHAIVDACVDVLANHFSMFGLQERFDETLFLMKERLGWEFFPSYLPHNIGGNRKDLNVAVKGELREFFDCQCRVYEQAAKIFTSRWEELETKLSAGSLQDYTSFNAVRLQTHIRRHNGLNAHVRK